MTPTIDDIRQRTWDFGLTVVTMVLLASLGLQSFIGTLYVWYAERALAGWEQGPGYLSYIASMNNIAAPQIVALVVVMGLCVPKRLFSRRWLLWVSIAMVAVGGVSGAMSRSLADGLTVYLLLSAAIQLAVVGMTVAGVRGPTYLTEGRLTKTGSGLLHLGFIIFTIVVVALQKSPMMMPVFSASAVLVTVGTALSFYADKFAWRKPHPMLSAEGEGEMPQDAADDDKAAFDDAPGEDAGDSEEPAP